MNRASIPALAVGSGDRLVTTAFFAALLHGVIILGVSFAPDDGGGDSGPTLEVTVVNQDSDEAPEDAEYIAQADQRGGGNTEERVRPRSALSSPSPFDLPGEAEGRTAEQDDPGHEPQEDAGGRETRRTTRETTVVTTTARNAEEALALPAPAASDQSPQVLVARLMDSSPDAMEPLDELDRTALARSDDLRERFIAVDTREAVFAEYLDAWRDKIERMGNLHYPDQARRDGLEGSLVLEVALNADGTIRDLEVLRASDHRILDRAALRILRLASPFDPFPDPVRREADVLRFVYEWRFSEERTQGRIHSPGP